ncbi:winged helix-turn-helix domain-containing protein [Micromonospora sp. WMMD1128]|uniref:winged helix-turn-helix domain-containing protein n=1 Tax=Micromonospora sp. WMMD1128 TaxID=3015150 RepID=UPI00248BFC26|nr:winged helix-turn-helix domain-containing protein [Micromonospora sp. WMMD1128]WBB71839.1 winged helix-turn-helix domain-containing protein [Micromonospora sp. WMMD1128]
MTADDPNATPAGADPAERPFSLVIGVTPSPAERLRLTELLDGVAPLLLVADLDELRELIAPTVDVRRGPPLTHSEVAGPPPNTPASPADGALVIDVGRSTARWGDRQVALTRLERDLLTCLTTEPVRVWSYAELHRAVWHDTPTQRRADVQSLVKRLRRKLDELGTGVTVVAVRGVGLRLTDHRRPRVREG